MSYWNREFVEFAPSINCPLSCRKTMCNTELISKNYKGDIYMSYKTFIKCLHNIPKDVDLAFVGHSEPFLNPDFVSMLITAHQEGYKIGVFTTLYNATFKDVELIKDIPFEIFMVHLPDGKNLKFNYSPDYGKVLHYVMNNFKNVDFISMNKNFVDCGNKNYNGYRHFGRCLRFSYPQLHVLTDGHIEPCCQSLVFGGYPLGDLKTTRYEVIRELYKKTLPFDFCNRCSMFDSYLRWFYLRFRPIIKRFLK